MNVWIIIYPAMHNQMPSYVATETFSYATRQRLLSWHNNTYIDTYSHLHQWVNI